MRDPSRRTLLLATTSSLLLSACRDSSKAAPEPPGSAPSATSSAPSPKPPDAKAPTDAGPKDKDKEEQEVTATEDMMREHGIIRRALVVYRETATRLRASAAQVAPEALKRTANLLRNFGEDYHEKKLEEAYVFPAVSTAGGPAAAIVSVLVAQHQRGRELTDYVLALTSAPKIGANAAALAGALEAFARMYEAHASREDTIVFPAWKKTMSQVELDDIAEKFETIEHEHFGGKDGFDEALEQIAKIERELGLDDLAQLTAAAPPKR